MNARIVLLLCLVITARIFAESADRDADGILRSIDNANVSVTGEGLQISRKDTHEPVTMIFVDCQAVGIEREREQWWVLPISATNARVEVNSALWVLPNDAGAKDSSRHIELHGGDATATKTAAGLTVSVNADQITAYKAEARPHSDPFGHRFSFEFADGAELEDALAGFYWGTMLPSVVEKTMAAHFPYSDGYVLSTLNVKSSAGSYPAVDHEFQTKGRLAMGSAVDLDVVRRMIELQFKLMNDDPERLYRAPTSVQPDGSREYHVRRNSMDNHQNAAMFPLTGNIEVIEESWRYYESTKDATWLRRNLDNLEHAAGWTLASVDQ